MMHQLYGDTNFDIAARKHKKHKIKISGLVNSMYYNEQKSKFRLFTNPSSLDFCQKERNLLLKNCKSGNY
jgi:hypothetical protein